MNWGAETQSPEQLSDSTPKTYICFCEKKFTTYPGIYLHMKSKHSNLFMKYKKLKITKLFRKSQDGKGGQVYRLQKISQADATVPSHHEINSQQIRPNHHQIQQNRSGVRLPIEREPRTTRKDSLANGASKKNEVRDQQVQNNLRFHSQIPRNMANGGQMPYSSMPNHFPFNMAPPPHMFPPLYYPQMSHPNYFQSQRPTIKKALERFLMESIFGEKAMVKKALYDLMVFIDKNYESINDPRAKNKMFLSYCDQFDLQFAVRLIQEYIGKLTQEKCQKKNEIAHAETEKEIDCLLRFLACSVEPTHMPPSMEYPSRRYQMPSEYDGSGLIFPDCFQGQRRSRTEQNQEKVMKKSAVEEIQPQ